MFQYNFQISNFRIPGPQRRQRDARAAERDGDAYAPALLDLRKLEPKLGPRILAHSPAGLLQH